MGSIREIKEDIQVFEIKREDISDTISGRDLEQSMVNIIKSKHHHADGSPVQLHVLHGSPLDESAARKYVQRESEEQAQRAAEQARKAFEEPQRQKGIDALASQAAEWGSTEKRRENIPAGSGQYSRGNDVSVKNVAVQCNCGMEFTGAGKEHGDMLVTGNKYNANTAEESASQYTGTSDEDWGGSTYQTGGLDDGGGSSYHRGGM